MKEKVGGAKIIVLIILIGIAAFSILTSKYIMTMKSIDVDTIEGVDFDAKNYEHLYEYAKNKYSNDSIELYPLD